MRKVDWPYVMAAARRQFGAGNTYGVQAFGIDRKVTSGRRLRESALNVYVLHKHERPAHAVPALVVRSRGLRIRPDVVGVGAEPQGQDAARFAPPYWGSTPALRSRPSRVRQFRVRACCAPRAIG